MKLGSKCSLNILFFASKHCHPSLSTFEPFLNQLVVILSKDLETISCVFAISTLNAIFGYFFNEMVIVNFVQHKFTYTKPNSQSNSKRV